MPVLDLIPFATFFLEDGDLIAARMSKYFPFNGDPIQGGGADLDFPIIILGQKDLIESDLFSFFSVELVDDDPLVLLDLVLMSSYLYDGIHGQRFS